MTTSQLLPSPYGCTAFSLRMETKGAEIGPAKEGVGGAGGGGRKLLSLGKDFQSTEEEDRQSEQIVSHKEARKYDMVRIDL